MRGPAQLSSAAPNPVDPRVTPSQVDPPRSTTVGVALKFVGDTSEAMKPGQRVRATLLLEEVEDALVVPRQAVVQEGGKPRVFVASGEGFEPRRVETAGSSLGLVVVTAGLEEGERIALSPPSAGGESESSAASSSPGLAVGGAP